MNYQIHNPKFPMSGSLEATKKGRLGLVPEHLGPGGMGVAAVGRDLCEFALDLDPPGRGRLLTGPALGQKECDDSFALAKKTASRLCCHRRSAPFCSNSGGIQGVGLWCPAKGT
jgi:hypothetical protein